MTLSEWLIIKGVSKAEFARRAGLGSRQLVHRYVVRETFPSPENLDRIRVATNDAVTADDLLTDFLSVRMAAADPLREAANVG